MINSKMTPLRAPIDRHRSKMCRVRVTQLQAMPYIHVAVWSIHCGLLGGLNHSLNKIKVAPVNLIWRLCHNIVNSI
jgi:hypothetical protein